MPSRLEEFRFARWANGLNRCTQILLGLILVTSLNFIAASHFVYQDITPDHRYSLSTETRAALKEIPHQAGDPAVHIVLIKPTNDSPSIRAALKQLVTLQSEFKFAARELGVPLEVEEVDPIRQPSRMTQLQKLGLTATTQLMVTYQDKSGRERARTLSIPDLFDSNQNGSADFIPTAFKGENAVISAILNVTDTKPVQIYFTKGHGEMSTSDTSSLGLSVLRDTLRLRNFTLGELDLTGSGEIPKDAKLVIIAGPLTAFGHHEVVELRQYLEQNGGRVLVFLQPGFTTGLTDLFHQWGVSASEDEIVKERNPGNLTPEGEMLVYAPTDGKHAHELTHFNTLVPVQFGNACPVREDLAAPDDERLQRRELLFSSADSLEMRDPNHISPTDLAGPVPLAVLSEQHAPGFADGRLLVFGNADFISNQGFGQNGNADLLLNAVNYLTNRDNMLGVRPKTTQTLVIGASRADYLGLAWRLALLPVAFLVLGAGVYFLRNR